MEQKDFLKQEEIRTSEKEIDVRLLLSEYASLKEENAILREQVAWLKKAYYGQKSEKTEVVMEHAEQVSLFNETEQEADVSTQTMKTTEVKSHTRKAKRTHDELAADLPVEEVLHEVEDKTCEHCGGEMTVIGKEKIRDELVYVPARLFLRRHIAEVVKCTNCGTNEENDASLPDIEPCHIKQAVVPAPMIVHSFCTPELLAHIVYEKYCQAVPLYRQEKDFAGKGVKLSRTTMANWIMMSAELWIRPIWEEMKKKLLASPVIHADETVVQVLNEPGKKAKTDSRMWVYANGKMNEHSNVLFEYQPTRNGDHAAKFLGNYSGYLVCDGFDGYNKLKGAHRCGCFAHVRRKFVEALPNDKTLLPTSQAAVGVEYCNKLFELEREFASLSAEERYAKRLAESKPVLDAFFVWVHSIIPAGGTKLAKAISYARAEKKYLYCFLENGNVPVDNNRAENAIRPFVVGRKNWLFSTSVKGAVSSAMFYSVVATACANGLSPEQYLTELFRGQPGSLVMPW